MALFSVLRLGRRLGFFAVFERFTEPARQVVVLAQEEARSLRHNYIGTEHILLGLVSEQDGLGARVLESVDVKVEPTRAQVVQIVGEGPGSPSQLPFTPRAKKVLTQGEQEANALDQDLIATHHLLLGLLRENDGVANRVLLDLGGDAQHLRGLVLAGLDGAPEERSAPAEALTRLSRGAHPGERASARSQGAPTAAVCSFCEQKGRHMFASFPPKAGEASICDLCLDLYHRALSQQRTKGPGGPVTGND